MKKTTLLLLFFTISIFVEAQSYIGFLTDNYNGVHGVISNPANITDSRLKTDINLGGASLFGSNDYYGFNLIDATKSNYNFDLESKKHPKDNNNGAINADVFGPSVMFSLSENSALAVFSRARAFLNVGGLSGLSIESLVDDTTDDFVVNEGNINIVGHSWSEIGVTYARTLLNKNKHFIKGGLSLKYLQGRASVLLLGTDVSINYDADGTDLGGGETTGNINSSGNITYTRFDDFDDDSYDYKKPDNATGFGIDLGFVYEFRPNHANYKKLDSISNNFKNENKYKFKVGVSITDVGFINYKEGVREAYSILNTNVNQDDFEAEDSFNDVLNTLYTQTNADIGYIVDLPTALHFDLDWNLNNTLYLNLNTDVSLLPKSRITANLITNVITLTPRYESKWFSFYMPLSIVENNGFRMGAGFRAGPLYLGSGSLISAFASDNNREADAYAGLKIPVYYKVPKDRDGDGIIDKLDDCPKIAGPESNNGCPIQDKDKDGVLDAIDECPEVAGPEENKGCPWGDKDNDTINDNEDSCPDEAGPVENKGCPWSDKDGDGVLDKDDDCIDEIGTIANKGCPELVPQEVQKQLNDYAKTILFNSGLASIKASSNQVLFDIITILKEYPKAKFVIEGHTDSIGEAKSNLVLSEKRAYAVKRYLVENFVDSSRLSVIGYGETKPIATNMYKDGRAQNRRVEINLIK